MTTGAGRWHRPRRATVASLAVLAAVVVAACSGATAEVGVGDANPPGFFPGQVVTDQGRAAAGLYDIVFWIAAAVFLLVEGLLLVITFRFRRRERDEGTLPAQTHGNNLLEVVWTAIPALIVTGLFVMVVFTLPRTSEARSADPSVVVDVQGFQWQWTFDYEAEGLSFTGAGRQGPQMVLPVGETVRIRLHSNDVNHSFYVPQFFYKKDVIPGRVNEFDVTVQEPGTYTGQCAEFCGLAHAEMYFSVRGVSRAEYDAWVAAEQEKARATAEPAPSGATTVEVAAIGIVEGFEPKAISVTADTPLSIALENRDASAPHDVGIRGATPEGDFLGDPDAPPDGTATYQVPPLAAGTYEFFCTIHPNMVGELTVGQ